MTTLIRTNNKPRPILYGSEVPVKYRKEFDYMTDDEFNTNMFFMYKGWCYSLGDFMCTESLGDFMCTESISGWDGVLGESYFSAVLIKLVGNEAVIVGQQFN